MSKVHPYLKFNDKKCREAMEFYKNCFGGEITLQTVGESPMAKEMPAETHDLIIHGYLKKGDIEFMASDMMRDKATVGDNVSVSVNCDTEEELRTIFAKLSEGGDVFMAPEKAFWGAIFAVVTDRYGVEWMLNYQMEKYMMK